MKFLVIKEYNDAPTDPIQISKGEEFSIIEESDPNGDWPNWLYCKGNNKEGWIPKQIISRNGSIGVSTENYSAKEFNLKVGETIIKNRELNGWIWGYKEENPQKLGWAPLNHLDKKKLDIKISELKNKSEAPMDLLLLADPSEELVKSYLNKGRCFTAELNGETVGVVLIMPTKPGTIEIMNLAVKEELHNKGIGKKLLLFAIEEIKKGDTKTIEIGTGNPGVVQMLLYQKCGFRIVDIDFDFFRRTHSEPIYENGIECRDMIIMRMEL